jgi:hypothetical protein
VNILEKIYRLWRGYWPISNGGREKREKGERKKTLKKLRENRNY